MNICQISPVFLETLDVCICVDCKDYRKSCISRICKKSCINKGSSNTTQRNTDTTRTNTLELPGKLLDTIRVHTHTHMLIHHMANHMLIYVMDTFIYSCLKLMFNLYIFVKLLMFIVRIIM